MLEANAPPRDHESHALPGSASPTEHPGPAGRPRCVERVVPGVLGRYSIHTESHGTEPGRETIILVNGALGTTAAFTQTIKYLLESFNVVAYDLPFAGKSKRHNVLDRLVTQEEESDILLDLLQRFGCAHVLALSWGGVAALLALARRPLGVKSGVVVSFSPVVNSKFHAYIDELRVLLDTPAGRASIGQVVNDSVGRYLPRLIRHSNHRHLGSLSEHEYDQVRLYIEQVIMLDTHRHVERCSSIEVPLLFVNGSFDEFATPQDARTMTTYLPTSRFAVIEGAGHFLDLETRQARALTRAAILGFLEGASAVTSR